MINLPKLEKVVQNVISTRYVWHDIEKNRFIEKIGLERNPVVQQKIV